MTYYSQNGWTANDRSVIKSYEIPGAPGGKVALRAGNVATILLYVATRFNKEVENLEWPGNWGYAERPIRGSTTTLSNHASGTAIDLNAPQHPLGTNPADNYSTAQIVAINKILNTTLNKVRVGSVVRWGGNYTGRKDGMHFEINVPPSSLQIPMLVAGILTTEVGGMEAELSQDTIVKIAHAVLFLDEIPAPAGTNVDGKNPTWTLASMIKFMYDNVVKIKNATIDPAEIAAAVIKALPAGNQPVTQEELEAALKNVLGSLDN